MTVPGTSMMEDARSAASGRKKTSTIAGKPGNTLSSNPAFQQYQSAVQLLQQGKYDKALAAFEYERLHRFDNGRPFIPNVSRRRVFHTRLLHSACANGLLQDVEPEFFADVELDEHQNGAFKGDCCGSCRSSGHRTPAWYLIRAASGWKERSRCGLEFAQRKRPAEEISLEGMTAKTG